MISRELITGVLLAGGRGMRMGGVDKGLQPFHGSTLAEYALNRLRPQVDSLLINANRNLDRYRSFGVPVVTDTSPQAFAGPLAGLLAALRSATTPYLACVPCDAPCLPLDLVARLGAGLETQHADIAIALTRSSGTGPQRQPVFTMLRRELADDLAAWLDAGGHKVEAWQLRHKLVEVSFDDERAFYNVNTLQALDDLENEDRSIPSKS